MLNWVKYPGGGNGCLIYLGADTVMTGRPLPSNTPHLLGARDRILDNLKDSKIPRVTYDTAPLMGPMMHQYKNVPALRLLIEPRNNNTASFEFFLLSLTLANM